MDYDYLGTGLKGLTAEDVDLVKSVREFAANVIRPVATELDRMTPEEAIAPNSPLWAYKRQACELGYHKMQYPENLGGLELTPLQQTMVLEELAWGSFGLALTVIHGLHAEGALVFRNEELIKEFVPPFCACKDGSITGVWAITEPDHGSDTLLAGYPGFGDQNIKAQCTARLDGNEWVINGQKAAWVSLGTVATHCILMCQVDPSRGYAGGGMFAFSLDRPGISRGKPLDKLGARDLNQGAIFFDDVRIPKRSMLVGPEQYESALQGWLSGTTTVMGVLCTGLARAGFEEALNYAKKRKQGGRLLVDHPNVQQKLFNMYSKVEASRQVSRAAFVYNRTAREPVLEYGLVAKNLATQTSLDVTSDAIQIFGANGISKDYLIEKLFRDARTTLICDGSNDSLAVNGGHLLAESYPRRF